jgi:antitoxin YokJ
MTEIGFLIEKIKRTEGCRLLPATGLPALRAQDRLPPDLQEFYSLCGGAHLFEGADFDVQLVEPDRFARSNLEIVGEECPDDISDSWYIVGRSGSEEAISIDCSTERLGRCYDSFWDRHAIAGSCPIVALSFAELVRRLLASRGGHWYWLAEGWVGHGDAYDGVADVE